MCFVLRETEFHCRSGRNVETKQVARSGVCEKVRWRYSRRLKLLQSFVCLMTSVASFETRPRHTDFCISSPIINGKDLALASYVRILSLEDTWNRLWLNLNFRGSVISSGDLSGCKSEIKLFLKANIFKNETFTCVCKSIILLLLILQKMGLVQIMHKDGKENEKCSLNYQNYTSQFYYRNACGTPESCLG